MKALIIYHTRTGNTEKAGKLIGSIMSSRGVQVSFEKINPLKEEGYLKSMMMAIFKREVPILNTNLDVSGYDLIVIGSPVWGWNITPPVNSYFQDITGINEKRIAAFTTMYGFGGERVVKNLFSQFIKMGGKLAAQVGLTKKDILNESMLNSKLEKFIDDLKI